MKIAIIDMDHLGRGIGKIDNKVYFVPKTIPGDVCEIKVVKETKNYNVARVTKLLISSPNRVEPICPYFYDCGGCNIQNLPYDKQLLFKKNKVINIFKKYLNIDINPKIIGSKKTTAYRNKITYHVNDSAVGLVSEFASIIPIDKCHLVSEKINELYSLITKEDLSNVKEFTIRECDNGLILSIKGSLNISELKDKCIEIYINDKSVYHKESGYIYLNDLKFNISNKSFFQINTTNITALYDEIIKLANFNKEDNVIDLYSGVGSISLYIAKYVNKVCGIEIVESGTIDALKNAKENNISNASFICSDVSKIIDKSLNGNVLIVDPPRIGLDKHTANTINNSGINKVIYVSCDPVTLSRDLKILSNYTLSNITLVDMFPETHHCESIVLLKLK